MASGRAPAKRWRRVRAKRRKKTLNNIMSRSTGKNCGRGKKRRRGHIGGTSPRAMVLTITEAVPLPVGKEAGLTEQVVAVAVAGRVQIKLTCAEKPFCGAMVITFVNVAGWPAGTVSVVVPDEVMEKSGGPATMKLIGAEVVGEGMGLTTEIG